MNDTDVAARGRSRRNVQIARRFGPIARTAGPGAGTVLASRSSET